jgi:hypothetical protein
MRIGEDYWRSDYRNIAELGIEIWYSRYQLLRLELVVFTQTKLQRPILVASESR